MGIERQKGEEMNCEKKNENRGKSIFFKKDPGTIFSRNILGYIFIFFILLFYLNLFLALGTILFAPFIVFPELSQREVNVFFGIVKISGIAAMLYYLFLLGAILLSFYKSIKEDGKEFLNYLKKEFGSREGVQEMNQLEEPLRKKPNSPSLFSPYLNNAFTLVVFLMFSIFCFEFFYGLFVTKLLGISRHIPSSLYEVAFWQRLYRLPEAPVIEELVHRTLLLGVPLYFIHNYGSKEHKLKPLLLSLFKRENRRYLFGKGLKLDLTSLLILLLSSAVFSLGHLGWDWTKLVPTFIGGVVLGILFLKKGLHVSILLHFSINSFSIFYLLTKENLVAETILTLIFFSTLFFGAIYLYFYLSFFKRRISEIRARIKKREFLKAITVVGGVLLFIIAVVVGFYLLMYSLEDQWEEETRENEIHLQEGDYQIFELGSFEKDDIVNGTLHLLPPEGEIKLFISNRTVKEEWKEKKGEEMDQNKFFLILHLKIEENVSREEKKSFKLRFEEPVKEVYLILSAEEESDSILHYTKKTTWIEKEELFFLSLCGLVIFLVLIFFSLACIYTSNYYKFSKKEMGGGWR